MAQAYTQAYTQSFREFREDYEGFDWKNGDIVFIASSNAAHTLIWSYGSQWQVMAEKYFDKDVRAWRHTRNTMVITLDM